MVEGAGGAPDPAAILQHLVELRLHSAVDEDEIVDLRHDDVDRNPAAGGGDERTDQFAIRQEIGRHDPDRVARHREGTDQQPVIGLEAGIRPRGDRAHHHAAFAGGRLRRDRPGGVGEVLARGEAPILGGDREQILDHRAGDTEMRVSRRRVPGEFPGEALPDVHAAGEGDLPVDDQEFAVRAQVRIGQPQSHDDVAVEDVDRHAALLQIADDARHRIARADRIDQNPHRDAAPARRDQRIGETQPDRIPVEDIGLEDDRAAGARDRFRHRGIGLVTGSQGRDGVAALELTAYHLVAERLQRGEAPAECARHRFVGDRGGLARRAGPELPPSLRDDRGPAHAIDAGDRIDQCAQKRGEQDDSDPADGGADLVLGQRGVAGGDHCDRKRQRGQDMRPVAVENLPHGADYRTAGSPGNGARAGVALHPLRNGRGIPISGSRRCRGRSTALQRR